MTMRSAKKNDHERVTKLIRPLFYCKSLTSTIELGNNATIRLLSTDEHRTLQDCLFHMAIVPPHFAEAHLVAIVVIIDDDTDASLAEEYHDVYESFDPRTSNIIKSLYLLKGGRTSTPFECLISKDGSFQVSGAVNSTISEDCLDLTEIDVSELKGILAKVADPVIQKNEKVEHYFRLFSRAYNKYNDEERLVASVIALEGIYGGRESHDNLSFKIRNRAAVFLTEEFEGRKAIRDTVKDLYAVRSRIVHASNSKIQQSKIHSDAIKAENLVRQSIKKILDCRLDGREVDENYLDELLLQ